ncbi:helix-turn-helix domain-containing protein [Nocardia terpenica]|uniref:helix-turn-helix domain-containing protein n=1 Tax=Nocardia terpenica TaxID=455432 RepID=UPI003D161ECC
MAAERFARGDSNTVIAKDFRVSLRSVQRWRASWRVGTPRWPRRARRRCRCCRMLSSLCWNTSSPGAPSRTAGRIRPGLWPGSRP